MRLLMPVCLLALAISCDGGKKFSSTTQKAAAEKPEPAPEVKPPVSEPLPESIDSESIPPGDPVEKFGINFEDNPLSEDSDKDYNDAVLCFEGKFVIQGSSVVSSVDQTIEAAAFTNAGCGHDIEIIINHSDGKAEAPAVHVLTRDEKKTIELKFKKGDSIEVKMGNTSDDKEGICANTGRHSMKEATWAQIAKNTCNDTGD